MSNEPTDDSVVRSLRLPRGLDDELRREAAERGTSVNKLVIDIIHRFLEWNRFADRFGYLEVARDEYRVILGSLSAEKLRELGETVGASSNREGVLFWYNDLTLNSFLSYIRLQCRYGRIAEYESSRQSDTVQFRLHHNLGEKYSHYLAASLGQLLKNSLDADPQIDIAGNSVSFRVQY
jgi:hypothetical protein